jgi:Transposase IS66 family
VLDELDLSGIQDPAARAIIQQLLNLVEDLAEANRVLREENQRLRDENNRLKGEQGQPAIKPNTPRPTTNHSSEADRRQPTPRVKRGKRQTINIDREQTCEVDPAIMPPDAEFKGYVDVVIQDVVLRTDNVLFHKAKWYAPSTRRTYLAELPPGYDDTFGPHIKALAITLAHDIKVSQPQILALFRQAGSDLAAGTLSGWLIHEVAVFHAEKDALYEAGLRSSPFQQIDDTATRVNGQNQHCHIVCNPLYTVYHTCAGKDRLSVLDVLRNGRERVFVLNAEALEILERLGLSAVQRARLAPLARDQPLSAAALHTLLDTHLPTLGCQQRKWVVDATAIAAYRAATDWPSVRLLLGDDAPQWTLLTEDLALCWVHEGRHYTKLEPVVPQHRRLLKRFRARFWRYYHALRRYQGDPRPRERLRLEGWFERLFATRTGYRALDERIAKTRAKKDALLQVLTHPEIPLHNNAAELGARQRVRKRDISFGPRTAAGTKAWDTFQSLAATAKKLGVRFYDYIHDRISGRYALPSLADLITQRANELDLGASWVSA